MLTLRAQTPITNTTFYQDYLEFSYVRIAEQSGIMTREIAVFLMKSKVAPDIKAAIVNALSFDILGKENAQRFTVFLLEKYKSDNLGEIENKLTADELMCLGYLCVLDDYFTPERGIPYLEKAKEKKPDDYTINMLLALMRAQQEIHHNKCRAWQLVAEVDSNNNLQDVMFEEARKTIMDFMLRYKENCPKD